ncbi:Hydrogenase 1 maturation peptidase HyaD [Desulfosporosinus acidiphilus SJ4]|uniref:Hydrogenase 1 maturation peptidase HyaD n=1 Tax=Desulfosporosinus acidiphilus (strain DSM 22704 / JCM 16185 / SJ4) TaxID=646529 RepID=I4D7K9_DESAJ|nr:HyaD/HybD family hydrogenase maturation endopeptidase [Desulfosporosinus acidiphilus]AFM41783.1 Hydrogenase 1 maturation peptidase HyaD [Desulfosporosinus acidiphilus SJ4]
MTEADFEDRIEIGILGLGNSIRQDEGFGIHLLERLRNNLPPEIDLLDGGTDGLRLLDFVEKTKRLIVLDAVDAGKKPGELVVWRGEEVPKYTGNKLSVHQMSFAEVLYWAEFQGHSPDEIVIIGVQPESLDWGTELTDTLQRRIPEAVDQVQACLKEWI